jgi:hypothetical protein
MPLPGRDVAEGRVEGRLEPLEVAVEVDGHTLGLDDVLCRNE